MSSNKTLLAELVYQESVGISRINWCISWCIKGGLTMEQAIAGRSKIRNVCIAEVFSQMGIIEQWGTGIQRMIQGCREYGVREPEFVDMGDAFRVNFYRSGRGCKFFCVYGGRILPIRFRYVPSSVELID